MKIVRFTTLIKPGSFLSIPLFLCSKTKTTSDLFNPYTKELVSSKQYLTEDEIYTKITSTTLAYRKWRHIDLEKRVEYVKLFIEGVISDRDVLKHRIAAEIGKSYNDIDT